MRFLRRVYFFIERGREGRYVVLWGAVCYFSSGYGASVAGGLVWDRVGGLGRKD